MKFKPYSYQKDAIEFILQHNACGIVLDSGMGKTVIALTAMYMLLYDCFEMHKILVVTSKVLAKNIWVKEIQKWNHLSEMKCSLIMGKEAERREAIKEQADIYIINIENIKWLKDNNLWSFDILILDEFYKFKNEKSSYFKDIMLLRSDIKRIIGLTDTLIINKSDDIWALCYLLDEGKRLGRDKRGFYDRFYYKEWKLIEEKYQLCREPKIGAEKAIFRLVKDIFYSNKVDDLAVHCTYKDMYIEMSPSEYSKYHMLENEMMFPDVSGHTYNSLEVLSKLSQAVNGIWTDDSNTKYVFHERKFAALKQIVKRYNGKRLLVACFFLQDREEILKRFPHALLLNTTENVQKWNCREYEIGIISPTSNEAKLQLGKGTDILVWYSLTWSPEIYNRLNTHIIDGKNNKMVVRIIMMATIEERMLLLLKKKKIGQEEAIVYLTNTREQDDYEEQYSDYGENM